MLSSLSGIDPYPLELPYLSLKIVSLTLETHKLNLCLLYTFQYVPNIVQSIELLF